MDKIKEKLTKSPFFIAFLRMRDKLAQFLLTTLLAFFDAVGPVWNFLFIKKPDEKKTEPR